MVPQISSKSPTIRRILREAAELSGALSPDYAAEPLESDLFEWHFTLRGPPNSAYSQGIYHGRIVLPPTYPLRPPSFRFTTPNGRFEANREICLSISGHHEETWQPAWGIRTALVALRTFMETDARGQLGGLDTTEPVRRRLASESGLFRCSACGKTNAEIIRDCEQRYAEHEPTPSERDIEVPQELKMGWKDELGAKQPGGQQQVTVEDPDSAELAEAFVPTETHVDTANSEPGLQLPPRSNPSAQPAQPAQGVPSPTNAIRAPALPAAAARQTAAPERQRAADDGVPVWVDRAIVVLVVLLVALLLKVLFSV